VKGPIFKGQRGYVPYFTDRHCSPLAAENQNPILGDQDLSFCVLRSILINVLVGEMGLHRSAAEKIWVLLC
jgi:hypothetical protein